MSYSTARTAITDRLKTYAGEPKIYAQNVATPGTETVQAGPWARWSIRYADARDAEVGGQRTRILGTLFFQLFIPEGKGTIGSEQFADKVAGLLNAKAVQSGAAGALVFERAQLRYVGKDGAHDQHAVSIAFREDNASVNA
jgi:hypothetical protein